MSAASDEHLWLCENAPALWDMPLCCESTEAPSAVITEHAVILGFDLIYRAQRGARPPPRAPPLGARSTTPSREGSLQSLVVTLPLRATVRRHVALGSSGTCLAHAQASTEAATATAAAATAAASVAATTAASAASRRIR